MITTSIEEAQAIVEGYPNVWREHGLRRLPGIVDLVR